ncbi:MurR/RpiR family transcriptional regulator [Enterococcus sp. DIV0242_7C1]|uniref:RpiR family phosphosugar-binding transcriptional regulator n=1 Tax=Candidatus Enterococcus dunnyi TaxID=1834192 RepID=A0A200J6S9_9ENTE|nr:MULTISPECIES: MurR/RpiR family transcriptional regulator [unclassified Enterococcus]MBO0469844.1 MurR/RpiR family transcriptional regulator [Enterococcus sp. DIV0242_7C1]OUZ32884.1 RpiR family phosphosugar-binding transcriptional regulator [Enterococcus sp. 9D6_DIV0238]
MKNHYLDQRIRLKKGNLSETEQKIAHYFVHSDEMLSRKTLEDMANDIEVSQSSIYQFVKKIGYNGFQDFKIDIARNSNYQPAFQNLNINTGADDILPEDSSIDIAKKVIQSNIYSLSNSTHFLTEELLDRVLTIIYSAKTLHFFGLGGSSIVAFDSFHKFIRTKYRCNYIFDYHMQLSFVTKLTSEDCVFIFSHSGQTKESVNLARQIKKTSAKIIVLTGNSGSELVTLANQAIIVLTEETLFRTESLASRISYLTVMDILYTNVMHHNYDQNIESIKKIRDNISTTKTNPYNFTP